MPKDIIINGIEYNVSDFDFHPVLKDLENIFWFFTLSNLALMNFNVQETLKNSEDPSILAMLNKYNKWTNLNIEVNGERTKSSANIKDCQVAIGKAMAIIMFDYLNGSFYNAEIYNSEEYQFLKFIRNGAAHGNKFNLKYPNGTWRLTEDRVISWSSKYISRGLQDKKVFDGFITPWDMLLLANYFSDRLKEIDLRK